MWIQKQSIKICTEMSRQTGRQADKRLTDHYVMCYVVVVVQKIMSPAYLLHNNNNIHSTYTNDRCNSNAKWLIGFLYTNHICCSQPLIVIFNSSNLLMHVPYIITRQTLYYEETKWDTLQGIVKEYTVHWNAMWYTNIYSSYYFLLLLFLLQNISTSFSR